MLQKTTAAPVATPTSKSTTAPPAPSAAPSRATTLTASAAQAEVETDDERFKRQLRELPVGGDHASFKFATPGELTHAQSLVDEVNAESFLSTAVDPNANLNRLEVWRGKR